MRIQAATFAIFPARLYTRHLLFYKNQTVKSDTDWDQPRPLDQASMEELQWWYQNINKWNGRSLLPSTPNQTIFVDASNTGWGCSWNHHRAHGYWTAEEAAQSINWRELKAAQLALKTFHPPPNSTVLIRTDNTTSLTYINKQGGTRSLPLLELATEVWTWCLRHKIMIQAQHIQGLHNKIADFESRRQFFKNQWMIKPPDNEVVTKLRVMDAGSRSSLYGCSLDSMDQLPESLRKSSLESYIAGIAQDQAGTSTFGDSGGTILAQCSLVPSGSTDGSLSPMDADTTSGADNISSDSSPISTAELDALRVAIIREQLVNSGLNAQAVEDMLQQRLAPTGTNLGYRKNQLRFLEWAMQHNVPFTTFTPAQLINFLADMRTRHNLQASTLKTLRAAVSHLHEDLK
ncbi:hypothetical protein, partial, partial [Parasitella parasitica]